MRVLTLDLVGSPSQYVEIIRDQALGKFLKELGESAKKNERIAIFARIHNWTQPTIVAGEHIPAKVKQH